MSSRSSHIIANKPNVVSEQFEDEVILVSLVNGNYYSLRNTAAEMWSAIERGVDTTDIVQAYTAKYGLSSEQVSSIDEFVAQLHEHVLVKPVLPSEVSPVQLQDVESTFQTPIVEAYSDMQDLLLLDPIHEVDEETGWPAKQQTEEKKDN